jgi:hypothetical protein
MDWPDEIAAVPAAPEGVSMGVLDDEATLIPNKDLP